MSWAFEISKSASIDAAPSARPHILILHKRFHQLGTKFSNIQACGGHSHPNHHTCFEALLLLLVLKSFIINNLQKQSHSKIIQAQSLYIPMILIVRIAILKWLHFTFLLWLIFLCTYPTHTYQKTRKIHNRVKTRKTISFISFFTTSVFFRFRPLKTIQAIGWL